MTDTHDSPTPSSLLPVSPPCTRLAIFAATVWEFTAVQAALPHGRAERCLGRKVYVATVGSGECWVMQTGVGPLKAAASARALFQLQTFSLSLSTGFACALTAAEIGDVLMGTDVAALDPGHAGPLSYGTVAGPARDHFCRAMTGGGPGPRCIDGRFVSIDRIVGRASEKEALARRTGAIGLDMESAALAREAAAAQVPFVIVRTVSDLLHEDLPLDFNLFLRPTGWLRGMAAVAANPRSLMGVGRLRRQSVVAAQNLTKVLGASIGTFFSERPELHGQTTP